eukprot:4379804-Ditylum_brightwellii.AAC.1
MSLTSLHMAGRYDFTCLILGKDKERKKEVEESHRRQDVSVPTLHQTKIEYWYTLLWSCCLE